jgi:hypothetical protein
MVGGTRWSIVMPKSAAELMLCWTAEGDSTQHAKTKGVGDHDGRPHVSCADRRNAS